MPDAPPTYPPLPLHIIGALKFRCERDASVAMKRLLDIRRRGGDQNEMAKALGALNGESLQVFMAQENVTKPGDVLAICNFYTTEFQRQLDALWSVLEAASGTGARRG